MSLLSDVLFSERLARPGPPLFFHCPCLSSHSLFTIFISSPGRQRSSAFLLLNLNMTRDIHVVGFFRTLLRADKKRRLCTDDRGCVSWAPMGGSTAMIVLSSSIPPVLILSSHINTYSTVLRRMIKVRSCMGSPVASPWFYAHHTVLFSHATGTPPGPPREGRSAHWKERARPLFGIFLLLPSSFVSELKHVNTLSSCLFHVSEVCDVVRLHIAHTGSLIYYLCYFL